jgi:hypothetical protein
MHLHDVRTRLALLGSITLSSFATTGCGSTPPATPDAGVDAFVPGPVDGGGTDGGGTDAPAGSDAGPDASTPPSALEMEVDAARADLVAIETAVADVPADEQVTAPFLALDILDARLDAVIGEKGLVASAGVIGEKGTTLALTTNAIPTIVIVRQLGEAIQELDVVLELWSSSSDPEEIAIHAAASAARARIVSLQTMFSARFREIVDLAASLPGIADPEYTDSRRFELTDQPVVVHTLIEGNTDSSASISVTCGTRTAPIDVHIIDEETGTDVLAPMSMFGTFSATFAARADDANALHVIIADPSATAPWDTCGVQIDGARHWRGAPIDLVPSMAVFAAEDSTFTSTTATMSSTISGVRSGAPADTIDKLDLIEQLVGELSSETGWWRAAPTSLHEEDIEVCELTVQAVLIPVAMAIETSSAAMSDRRLDALLTDLGELRASAATGTAALRP